MADRADEIARRALDASRFDDASDYERSVTSVAQALRRQDAETREACAKIAEAETLTGTPPLEWDYATIVAVEVGVSATAKSIASAIRKSVPSHSNEKGTG